jgi:hypothetical protein
MILLITIMQPSALNAKGLSIITQKTGKILVLVFIAAAVAQNIWNKLRLFSGKIGI